MWRLLERPSRLRLAAATLISILAVHCLYQNAIIVLALCLGGGAVAAKNARWSLAGAVGVVGVVSAVSLLPYIAVVRRASEWNEATQIAIDFDRITEVLHRALAASGSWIPWIWGGLLFVAVALAVSHLVHRPAEDSARRFELSLFLLSSTAITTIGYYLFLRITKFPTEEWYYLLPMAIVAVAGDALIAAGADTVSARFLRPLTALIAAAFVFPVAVPALQIRATNADILATRLNEAVSAKDVIVVHPWFCAVSIGRYYTGAAKLMTLPPLADHKLQRLDLFKQQMAQETPLRPVLVEMEAALRTGGTVWLVGEYPFANPPQPAPSLPPAGEGPEGWRGAPYMAVYGMEAAYFIQMNALQSARVDVPVAQPVHPFERLPLRTVSGWRSSRWPW